MKKFALVCVILVSVVSITMGKMSSEEWERARDNCDNLDKSACEALINNGLPSVEQCDKKGTCRFAGAVYYNAMRYREAIRYFEKAIALGDNEGYGLLGIAYGDLQDYHNAKKYFEMACNKGNGDLAQTESCFNLGVLYYNGKGVHKDYAKVAELWKKACDMQGATACNNLGELYAEGKGVRQNFSNAKQYYGKACDLGNQMGCDNYRELNEQGVQ